MSDVGRDLEYVCSVPTPVTAMCTYGQHVVIACGRSLYILRGKKLVPVNFHGDGKGMNHEDSTKQKEPR